MRRIAKIPPARAYASMADMCYKHYQLSLGERKMVDASYSRLRPIVRRLGKSDMRRSWLMRTTKCVDTRCYKCDIPIWVPVYDYHEERNYCYPCGMVKMGAMSEYSHTTQETV